LCEKVLKERITLARKLALAVLLSGILFSILPVSEAQTVEDTLETAITRIDELEEANVELQNEIDFLRERVETAYSQTHSAHLKIQTLETTVLALAAILGITLIIALYAIYALKPAFLTALFKK